MDLDLEALGTTLDEVVKSIEDIDAAMTVLSSSKLNERAIIILIQHAVGPSNITQKQVRLVLNELKNFKKIFLKKGKGDGDK